MIEIWKPIPEFPGYEASTLGNIRSWKRLGRAKGLAKKPHLLKQVCRGTPRKGQQLGVTLSRNGKTRSYYIHRIVLETFVGPCPDNMEACHYDGDKDNNQLDNLRWDTHAANEQDKIRHGRSGKGSKNSQAKLKENQVIEIRNRYEAGESCSLLAGIFSIGSATVVKIVTGKRWKHIGGPIHEAGEHYGKRTPTDKRNYLIQHPELSIGSSNGRAILNEQKVCDIRSRAKQGEKPKDMAQEYGVCIAAIYHVISYHSWKHVD